MIKYIVPLPPVTKKNHQRIMKNRSTGARFVAPSEQYTNYASSAAWYLKPAPEKPIDYPVNVRCLFYLPTRRKTDLTNLLEAIDDIMVNCGIFSDDNYAIIQSHDGSRCYVDRENPRTEIYIEVANAPAAGVEQVVHAHWEPFSKTENRGYKCSHCKKGRISNSDYYSVNHRNYCYNCGAKMDEQV